MLEVVHIWLHTFPHRIFWFLRYLLENTKEGTYDFFVFQNKEKSLYIVFQKFP